MHSNFIGLIAFLVGLVLGVTLAALSVPNSSWLEPQVLGPIVGAFMAAVVGLGGVAWSRWDDRHRRKLGETSTRRALATGLRAEILWRGMAARQMKAIAIKQGGRGGILNMPNPDNSFRFASAIIYKENAGKIGLLGANATREIIRFYQGLERVDEKLTGSTGPVPTDLIIYLCDEIRNAAASVSAILRRIEYSRE